MSHMKLKKISKTKKIKIFIYLIIIYLFFSYTFYYSFKNIASNTNEEFILFLLHSGNSTITPKDYFSSLVTKSTKYLLHIDIRKPVSFFNDTIIGYKKENNDELEDINKLKAISSYIDDPNKKEIKEPLIYLYNSHQLENYNSDNLMVYGISPNVLMASYLLKEKLNEKGIPSIVETTNLTEFIELNKWPYYESYRASRIFLLDKIATYPTLKYFIDIHRDSVNKKESTITINGKDYAKILFVIGLDHSNHQANYEVTNNLNKLIDNYYPGLSRGIYKKTGPDVNGIYNQDINPNVILIELGGVDNNIYEVLNTINALTEVITKYVKT